MQAHCEITPLQATIDVNDVLLSCRKRARTVLLIGLERLFILFFQRKAKQKVENDEDGSNVPLLHGGTIDDGRQDWCI